METSGASDARQDDRPRVVGITGSSGLIGSRLVLAFQGGTTKLRLLSRNPGETTHRSTHVLGNLLDRASLRTLMQGTQELVHLAGVAHTRLRTEADRSLARAVNVEGTKNIIEAAVETGVQRLIMVSSAHVYAGQEGLNLTEESPTLGDSAYGDMKLEAEAIALSASARGFNVVIIRPCITYGPGVRFNLFSLMTALRRGRYVHVAGVNPVRSFASVDTVASAIIHLLKQGKASSIYNVADQHPVGLVDWINDISDLMQVRRPRIASLGLLRSVAMLGTTAAAFGLSSPLTLDSLRKLTVSFSLDVSALAQTGFVWPNNEIQVLRQTIEAAHPDLNCKS